MDAPTEQSKADDGQSRLTVGLGDWIAVPTLKTVGEYPDFRLFGFHTKSRVEVRFSDGTELVTFYGGYGMFGPDNREDVTHWRPSPNK